MGQSCGGGGGGDGYGAGGRGGGRGGGGRGTMWGRDGVRVRQGDVGAVHPSRASPGATGGVKLLTSVWTVVSGRAQVHQGNETPGFYYGPR